MKNKKIIFRPTTDLTEEVTPAPEPIKNDISKWYKNLKRYINDGIISDGSKDFFNSRTAKTCIPFFDSMTYGYSYKLPYDIFCTYNKEGERKVQWGKTDEGYVGSHKIEQIGEYPIPQGYENIILKVNTTWCVQTPPGYSLLYMHPLGRFDLPFYSFHGIVDSDKFYKNVNMPMVLKVGFEGTIKAGTPISQLIPIKRESWVSEKKKFYEDNYNPYVDNIMALINLEGFYKNNKWVKKECN